MNNELGINMYKLQTFLFVFVVFIFIFYSLSFILYPSKAYADDTTYSLANYLPIQDKVVKDGDIVSFSPKGYFLSNVPYDAFAVGIVDMNPAISLEVNGPKKTYPVISSGDAMVNVTSINGDIKKDDPIAPSKIAGAGMKADKSGYIIGVALSDYNSKDKKAVGQVLATINVHYVALKGAVNSGILDIFNLSTIATYEEPLKVMRYVIAAVVIISSFAFGFFSFARTANKGIEALGRNPLASKTIHLGILLNIIVTLGIILGGLVVSFFVIRL